ncbi:MAG: hypothetical protein ICV78_01605 [Tolypothrix sp. Co-bin9]|nr:hypothetical protein [Tolypothrix sp. Co-bin9]
MEVEKGHGALGMGHGAWGSQCRAEVSEAARCAGSPRCSDCRSVEASGVMGHWAFPLSPSPLTT